jgi:hypothetical protein
MAHDAARGLERRHFLRLGGVSVGLVALTAACVNEPADEQVTQTGTRIPAPSTSVPPFPGSAVLDAQMVLTALSVERLTIETFDLVLKEPWVADATSRAMAGTVLERHRAHEAALATQARQLGQDPSPVGPNAEVKSELVENELGSVREAETPRLRETGAMGLLATLEDTLAQFYAKAAGTSTTRELRSTLATLGVSTARQFTVLAEPAGVNPVPMALLPTAAANIPEEAYVTVDAGRLPKVESPAGTASR